MNGGIYIPALPQGVERLKRYTKNILKLGQLYQDPEDGNIYRWIEVDGSSASVKTGESLTDTATFGTVTNDRTAAFLRCSGVGEAGLTLSPGEFGFVLVRGNHASLELDGDDDVVKNDTIYLHASTDGVGDRAVIGAASNGVTKLPFAQANANDITSGDRVSAYVNCKEFV